LARRARCAPEVAIWGSGTPRRELLHVDDMAEATVHVMALPAAVWAAQVQPMCSHLNVGTGEDVTIRELAEAIARVTGYTGRLVFDPSKPDGTPRKLLDVSRLTVLGWRARIGLEEGLRSAYAWYRENAGVVRG
jgi:GDP-L-fucose synthase